MAGSGSVNSFSWRGAISSAGRSPDASVSPSAFTDQRPSTTSLAFTKSNQFFTRIVPSARSTGVACR